MTLQLLPTRSADDPKQRQRTAESINELIKGHNVAGTLPSSLSGNQAGAYTLVATDIGRRIAYTGGGGDTFTLGTAPPMDAYFVIINAGSGNLTIASTAINWLNGSGAIGTGSRTLAIAGIFECVHAGGGTWNAWGIGIT